MRSRPDRELNCPRVEWITFLSIPAGEPNVFGAGAFFCSAARRLRRPITDCLCRLSNPSVHRKQLSLFSGAAAVQNLFSTLTGNQKSYKPIHIVIIQEKRRLVVGLKTKHRAGLVFMNMSLMFMHMTFMIIVWNIQFPAINHLNIGMEHLLLHYLC